MSNSFVKINSLSVSKDLADFVNNELLDELEISSEEFWSGFDKHVNELAPINLSLIHI